MDHEGMHDMLGRIYRPRSFSMDWEQEIIRLIIATTNKTVIPIGIVLGTRSQVNEQALTKNLLVVKQVARHTYTTSLFGKANGSSSPKLYPW